MNDVPTPDAVNITARDLVTEVRAFVDEFMRDVLRMGMQGGEAATNAYARACMENIHHRRMQHLADAHDALASALNAASPDQPPILSLNKEQPA